MGNHYIIRVSAAHMPSKCKGTYRRIGLMRVPAEIAEVSQIRDFPDRGISVVRIWDKLNVGTSDRCAYRIALAEAEAEAARLNAEMATKAAADVTA